MVDVTVIDEPQKLWDKTSACYLILLSTMDTVFEGFHITAAGKLSPSEQTTASCSVMAWNATFYAKGVVPSHSFIRKLEAPEWLPLMQGLLSSKPHSLQILLWTPMEASISTHSSSSQYLSYVGLFIHVHFSLSST